ncbi:MAG: single-stranded-DNA-specific exonuclease RecJ [Bacteroidales bacterium]|jgi:single-stranded-DNA-specific exonuclease|nr:single-stranded-DNA-specific exonuclease RecJ [Bacteroidales bacterium]MDI9574883.1 single-stranded-DNA-specific exonuclease RecJ [Bacteroidota bacterium]MDD2592812.1 single-stranded-DNA-specific exonuclease RecJ [Bacteroidales bacterium]MDD3756110.1 single-stranded-DNA-specific exonuclease RecJ [Bacteroidales bacterium]MDY0401316.1 single-stranded-DNA-specific exonuclease RecJ [Bacteroidales bacterium]
MQIKRWRFKPKGDDNIITELNQHLGIGMIASQLLVQRGITNIKEAQVFLRPRLDDLYDPYLMKDMDNAVKRIAKALNDKEKILLYGDYDVDGITSVANLYLFLSRFTNKLDYYIPDRYTEKSGISEQSIEFAIKNGYSLIIASDCGTKEIEIVEYANKNNIDFIICDHHKATDTLPNAVAVLNPQRKDCNYPFKDLSGCGVGFKLIQALAKMYNIPNSELTGLMQLLALSIAADMVPVIDENRILAKFGLKYINENPLPGIEAVLKVSGIKRQPDNIYHKDHFFSKLITLSDLVFLVAPRVNAAGRIQNGRDSVDLLVCNDITKADILAEQINNYNEERKNIDFKATNEALEMIENYEISNFATILYNPNWPKGVLGIVAARLTEQFHRPTIILTWSHEDQLISGSARSTKNFNLYEALDQCSDLLENWGGHTYATGISLKEENLEEFTKRFVEIAEKLLTENMLISEIEIDAELDFNDITKKFVRILNDFEPYGTGNPQPIFYSKNVYDAGGYTKIVANNHLKLFLSQPHYKYGPGFPAFAYNSVEYYDHIVAGKPIDIIYNIEENDWVGTNTIIQLNIKDIIKKEPDYE